MDILEHCRLCMSMCKCRFMTNIFDAKRKKLIDDILYCTGIKISQSDILPTYVCSLCVKKLSIAYNFKTKCVATDNEFQKLKGNLIKKDKQINRCKSKPKPHDDNALSDDTGINTEKDFYAQNIDEKIKNIKYDIIKNVKLEYDNEKIANSQCNVKVENVHSDNLVEVKVQCDDVNELKCENINKENNTQNVKTDGIQFPDVQNQDIEKDHGYIYTYGIKIETPKDIFQCKKCIRKFQNAKHLLKHIKEEHNYKVCEICGVQCSVKNYYRHRERHSLPMYMCDQCDYRATHKDDLNSHLRVHSGEQKYQCEICQKKFRYISNMHVHKRNNHGIDVKHYVCPICSRSFKSSNVLKTHLNVHNKIKRYSCNICQAKFTLSNHRRRHVLSRHGVVLPRERPGRKKSQLQLSSIDASID